MTKLEADANLGPSFIFVAMIQHTDKEQLRGERVSFDSQFQAIVHHRKKIEEAGT